MTNNIYALLVGIDAYSYPVPPLQGCVNDIRAIEEYLQTRVAEDNYRLRLRTLIDEQATRQGIIDGFRQHLAQADSEDVVVFYYAGHGSQEQAPPEFWQIEPDRLNETLVCYDSRNAGGWDLADKELAKLIAEVAERDPHIVVFMDCCHSASGTRGELTLDTTVRKAPVDKRHRPLSSFLVSPDEIPENISASRSLQAGSGWHFNRGKHIFFSACRDSELAKEYHAESQKRGVFSYFLLDTLQKANGSLTYRELFKRTKALVQSKVTAQSPQLEATETSDLDRPFLGGAIAPQSPYFTVSYRDRLGWIIDGGAVNGIPQPTNNETTELALFPFNINTEQLNRASATIARAKVVTVMPQLSQIQIEGENLGTDITYKAVVTSLPLPPKGVYLAGELAGIERAREALANSLYLTEVAESTTAELQLLARNGEYLITRPVDDRALVGHIIGYTEATATQAVQRLEHIVRWTNIAELASSPTSAIAPNAVTMSIYQEDKIIEDPEIHLAYTQQNGSWQQPTFKVKLENTSNQPLYCALLDLTDRYAVSAELLATGGIWLQPGESGWALEGQPIYSEVDRQLWERGITEVKDILKLIVSTTEFDPTLLEQDELDLPPRATRNLKAMEGTLNRLMQRVQTRAFSSQAETETVGDRWMTSQVSITTVRPPETIPISKVQSSSLGMGVELQSHPQLQAKARLNSITQSTRNISNSPIPPILQDERVQPFQFTASRGSDPGLGVLELTEVQNPETVTKTNPLKLTVENTLAANEQLLPIAYDGEFYLPLGWGRTTNEGKTEILLERLPQPVVDSRSLTGSIRILFQKLISKTLKREFEYPLLAVADVDEAETVTYESDRDAVTARVEQAETIVLYIHGIIGDTEDMVRSVRRTTLNIAGESRNLFELYDLVLTFDYENLHTPIEENARLLKQRLESVGLGANSGKKLHIIAHSMGGLVSRWFIEREGGNEIVRHLIMLGTPNGGSPWSKVEDWAVTMLSAGLNSLTTVTWSVPIIGMLTRAIALTTSALEIIDVSLDQMQSGSEFLNNLAASPDPGIPYSIVAGNTSIIPAALESKPNNTSLFSRLTQKLFNRVVEFPFLGQPNDIAVSVASIKNVSLARSHQPQIQEVGCDHLVYFRHAEGLKGLSDAVAQALGESQPTRVLAPKATTEETTASSFSPSQLLLGLILCVAATGAIVYWTMGGGLQTTEPPDSNGTREAINND